MRFAMLDLDGNGKVDALDFLQIRSQLELRLHEVGRSRRRPSVAAPSGPPSLWGRLRSSSLFLRARGLRERFLDGVWSRRVVGGGVAERPDPRGRAHGGRVHARVVALRALLLLVWPGQSAATLAALCHASLGLALLAAAFTCARLMATRATLWLLPTCSCRCRLVPKINDI